MGTGGSERGWGEADGEPLNWGEAKERGLSSKMCSNKRGCSSKRLFLERGCSSKEVGAWGARTRSSRCCEKHAARKGRACKAREAMGCKDTASRRGACEAQGSGRAKREITGGAQQEKVRVRFGRRARRGQERHTCRGGSSHICTQRGCSSKWGVSQKRDCSRTGGIPGKAARTCRGGTSHIHSKRVFGASGQMVFPSKQGRLYVQRGYLVYRRGADMHRGGTSHTSAKKRVFVPHIIYAPELRAEREFLAYIRAKRVFLKRLTAQEKAKGPRAGPHCCKVRTRHRSTRS
jgi:hypothetical protein